MWLTVFVKLAATEAFSQCLMLSAVCCLLAVFNMLVKDSNHHLVSQM